MSQEIQVKFDTQRFSEVPRVGQRKRVQVNGRVETKYVKRIEVEARKFYAESLRYRGVYWLTDYSDLWA